jgi:hypothetical protein
LRVMMIEATALAAIVVTRRFTSVPMSVRSRQKRMTRHGPVLTATLRPT